MALTPFDISVAPGDGRVVIDGQDVTSQVAAVTVQAEAGGIPQVYLQLRGEGRIEGEGIVHSAADLDQRQVVLEFLGNIDPGVLEGAALERCGGLGADETTGQAFLNALIDMVQGGD